MTDRSRLTTRQQAFIRHYLAGADGVRGNAKKAAIAAGFARRSAEVTGSRMLRKAKVAAAIKSLQEKADASVVRRLRDWQELAVGAQETMEQVRAGKIKKGAVVRLMAADKILDRALGKPPTKVQLAGAVTLSHALDALDEIDNEDQGGERDRADGTRHVLAIAQS
jgi:hypothetical protein